MKKSKHINNYIITFLIVSVIILFIYFLEGYTPFGNNTLATMDAEIQYLDLFMYLKDVLLGKNSISYSFGAGLGGNMIAVFSYYLSSPLNLLIIFFNKSNLEIFFNLIVMIKLSIAAVTCTYFLKHRFNNKIENYCVILLSVSYALCQYNIAQSSNIMWLDGVYLLPLILLGVYNNINKNKSLLLICSVAASVIFNWYTGLINCIFSIFWFILEIAISEINNKEKFEFKKKTKELFSKALNFGIVMIIGGLISAIILLPTAISLQSGRGTFEFGLLKNWSFVGDILTVIPEYTLGAVSEQDKVSLFCGSFVLIGLLGSIFSNKLSKKERILFGIFLGIIILMFYWNPFFVVFSIFKDASSYWFRYSYVGIFSIIFISAYFYKDKIEINQKSFIKPILIFILLVMLLNAIFGVNSINRIYLSVIFMIAIACSLIFINYVKVNKKFPIAILCILVILEMTYSTKALMDIYHTTTSEIFSDYVQEGEEQIEEIKSSDNGFYRISQTATRNMNSTTNLTANYNEPLAFGYSGISIYTSDPDEKQRTLLENLGYRKNGDNMNIVNTSILGSDSLLGVKYILSEYQINGLEETEISEKNGKSVYENPYVLPLAFTYETSEMETQNTTNPFEYQNELYSKLLNEEVELYIPLNFTSTESTEVEGVVKTYNVEIPEGNYAVYGNLYIEGDNTSTLNVNDEYSTGYFCWLSPAVFYIPTSGENEIVKIELTSEVESDITQEQFYALQLDVLEEVTNKIIENNTANIISMENGKVCIEAQSDKENGEKQLLISIPYDEGWKILVNGEEVEPEIFEGCLISIPLENGDNYIEMTYSIPYFKISIVISILGIVLLIGTVIYEKRDIKNERGKK